MANLKTSSAIINLFNEGVNIGYYKDDGFVNTEETETVPVKITVVKNLDTEESVDAPVNFFGIIIDLKDLCDKVSDATGLSVSIEKESIDYYGVKINLAGAGSPDNPS